MPECDHRVRRRCAVVVGFGRCIGGAAVFGRYVGQRKLEFGESDHGEEGLCLSSRDRAPIIAV
jgi:hypothetical protein